VKMTRLAVYIIISDQGSAWHCHLRQNQQGSQVEGRVGLQALRYKKDRSAKSELTLVLLSRQTIVRYAQRGYHPIDSLFKMSADRRIDQTIPSQCIQAVLERVPL
jgi:hypothetical protein